MDRSNHKHTIHRIPTNTPQKVITWNRSPRTSRRTLHWRSKREKRPSSYCLRTHRSVVNATSWACVGFSLEDERVMQQSRVSIFLGFWEPRYQSSRRPRTSHLVPTQTNKNLATNAIKGLSIPSRPLARVRSDRDNNNNNNNKINVFGILWYRLKVKIAK